MMKECTGQASRYTIIEQIKKTGETPSGRGQAWRATVNQIINTDCWLAKHTPQTGDIVVLKWPNIQSDRAESENRAFLSLVNESLDAEINALEYLIDLPCVPKIYDAGKIPFKIGERKFTANFLVEEYLQGPRLMEYLEENFKDDSGRFTGIQNPKAFFQLAIKLVEALRSIHRCGIIHGDIWYKNIMIRDGNPVFFDFGAAVFRLSTFLRPEGTPWGQTFKIQVRLQFWGQTFKIQVRFFLSGTQSFSLTDSLYPTLPLSSLSRHLRLTP